MADIYRDTDPEETLEWIESIEDTLEQHGFERTRFLLEELIDYAQSKGARLPFNTNTPLLILFTIVSRKNSQENVT